jgi:hypothetical protein
LDLGPIPAFNKVILLALLMPGFNRLKIENGGSSRLLEKITGDSSFETRNTSAVKSAIEFESPWSNPAHLL